MTAHAELRAAYDEARMAWIRACWQRIPVDERRALYAAYRSAAREMRDAAAK